MLIDQTKITEAFFVTVGIILCSLSLLQDVNVVWVFIIVIFYSLFVLQFIGVYAWFLFDVYCQNMKTAHVILTFSKEKIFAKA